MTEEVPMKKFLDLGGIMSPCFLRRSHDATRTPSKFQLSILNRFLAKLVEFTSYDRGGAKGVSQLVTLLG